MVNSFLFLLKVKWKNSIRKARRVNLLNLKRVQKILGTNPERIKGPVLKEEETISKNFSIIEILKTIFSLFLRDNYI